MDEATQRAGASGERRRLVDLRKLPRSPVLSKYRAALDRAGKKPHKFPSLSYFSAKAWLMFVRTYVRGAFLRSFDFPTDTDPFQSIYPLSSGAGAQKATIAMAGDWATGTNEALAVTELMAPKEAKPDYTIHLGDIYYVGDQASVEETCLGKRQRSKHAYAPVTWRSGRLGSFALNGNHEMYAGGGAYFSSFLPTLGLFDGDGKPIGQKVSFFCLENDFWRIIALDTGYHSRGLPLISMLGQWIEFLRPSCRQPEEVIAWLRDVVKLQDDRRRGLILLTHHQYYSEFEERYIKAAQQLAQFIDRPVLWFWGHEHRMAGYRLQGPEKIQAHGRCIGHGGMPVERHAPPDHNKVVFFDNRVYSAAENFSWNGYVTLNFQDAELTVRYFDIAGGDRSPLLTENWSVGAQGQLRVNIEQQCISKDFYGPQNWGGRPIGGSMLVDLHAHYAMHLDPDTRIGARGWMTKVRHRAGFTNKARGALLKVLSGIEKLILKYLNNRANFPGEDTPAITIENLKAGGVGVILSVLYAPFDEIDLTREYAAPPAAHYLRDVRRQMLAVEDDIATRFAADAAVVHNHQELQGALREGKVALIHAIEGGFQLGETPEHIAENARKLAEWGVAYVTIAHLFFREVATNAPAIPFLPEWLYRLIFPQSSKEGLTDLGRAVIRELVKNRVLIDLTHMSEVSIDQTLGLLKEIDPANQVPVIASHGAYRFGKLQYNLTDEHIRRIKERNGVIGLIACDHFMADGLRGRTSELSQSLEVMRRHIDKIKEITGSYDHIAIGSDLDGFIKPTLKGLEFPMGYNDLHRFLEQQYGPSVTEQIMTCNARRVLDYWSAGTRCGAAAGGS
jgi:microsomal dipeptidase-like Zn-dependent dipeptidase